MKRLSIIFLLLGTSALFSQGIPVEVELHSGVKQYARFLGIFQDTVHLGGTVQGKFTQVRLPQSAFKEIRDEQGNILSLDSLADLKSQLSDSSENDSSWKNRSLFVSWNSNSTDSKIKESLQNISFFTLSESDTSLLWVSHNDFRGCLSEECMVQKAQKSGANTLFSGQIKDHSYPDSIIIELQSFFFQPKIRKKSASITLSRNEIFKNLLTENRWIHFLYQTTGLNIPEKKKPDLRKNYFFIDSDPEGAIISKRGGEAICKTPCAFTTLDTTRTIFDVYWRVGNNLWAAEANLLPIAGDTAKASLKLKRVQPVVEFLSIPSGAEVFSKEPVTAKSKMLGTTPKNYHTLEPGFSEFRLWHAGYRDTLVRFYVNPNHKTVLETTLTPLTEPQEIENQKNLIRARKRYSLGITLMGTSIAPAVAGGILTFIAYEKYDQAKRIKQDLERPGTVQGDKYQSKKKQNKKYADQGDHYLYSAIACFGTAAALLGIGFAFTF